MKRLLCVLWFMFCFSVASVATAHAANVETALSEVFGNEGGLQCRKDDQGNIGHDGSFGCTKWGVTHRDYPRLDIPTLTKADAGNKVYRPMWKRMKLDSVTSNIIATEAFDGATNMGEVFEIKLIQQAVNLANGHKKDLVVDGIAGPAFVKAVNECSGLLLYINMIGLRYDRYRFLATANPKKYQVSFDEWLIRISRNVRKAVHEYETLKAH